MVGHNNKQAGIKPKKQVLILCRDPFQNHGSVVKKKSHFMPILHMQSCPVSSRRFPVWINVGMGIEIDNFEKSAEAICLLKT